MRLRFLVPGVLALANDPDNERVFARLDIPTTFSVSPILGSLIEQRSAFGDIVNLLPVASRTSHCQRHGRRSRRPAKQIRRSRNTPPGPMTTPPTKPRTMLPASPRVATHPERSTSLPPLCPSVLGSRTRNRDQPSYPPLRLRRDR